MTPATRMRSTDLLQRTRRVFYADAEVAEIIVDCFAGGGGASTGIELAVGRPVDIAINHDPAAIAMHRANHPDTEHYCESVWEVDPRKAVDGRPVGLVWLSPDCFPAGTMVLTRKGYEPIEDIQVGDEVLTHKLRWRKVTEVSNARKPLLSIKGHGHPGLTVSLEHPFYARLRRNIWRTNPRGYERTLEPAEWVPASMLEKGWYWATPTKFPQSEVPEILGRGMTLTRELMWLAGRYLGDGWTRLTDTRAELVITCGMHEIDSLRKTLGIWTSQGRAHAADELNWQERKTGTAYQFTTNHRGLVTWLRENFSHRAESKRIPAWALGMPEGYRKSLLTGYLSADGWNEGRFSECRTVSKALAFGIKALLSSIGKTVTVHLVKNSSVIEGRQVNSRMIYMLRWRAEVDQDHAQTFRDKGLEWCPIRSQEDLCIESDVFNIGVEDDESYIVEGIVVHNCKHFSKAKGGKPVEKSIRSLAWVAARWAATVRPRVIVLENVEEFKTWGPLLADGRPDPKQKGREFNVFVNALKHHGYQVEWRELRACDYGAPTIRKRFFLVARRDGQPIAWPEPTHGAPESAGVKSGRLKPWRTASEIIDCSLPCPSIFERKRPLAENTMRRIARGIFKFVIEDPHPSIVRIDKPLATVTTKAEHLRVSAFLAQYRTETAHGDARGRRLSHPILTLDTSNRSGLATSHVVKLRGTNIGHRTTEPLHTVTAGGTHLGEVRAFLTQYNGSSIGQDLRSPINTISTHDRFGLVTIQGQDYEIVDIGMRMLEPHELFAAQGFPSDYIIDRDADGNAYPKSAQVARCGNAVPPPFAEALVRANLPEMCEGSGAA